MHAKHAAMFNRARGRSSPNPPSFPQWPITGEQRTFEKKYFLETMTSTSTLKSHKKDPLSSLMPFLKNCLCKCKINFFIQYTGSRRPYYWRTKKQRTVEKKYLFVFTRTVSHCLSTLEAQNTLKFLIILLNI